VKDKGEGTLTPLCSPDPYKKETLKNLLARPAESPPSKSLTKGVSLLAKKKKKRF
jgi:hypothetical protein